MPALAAPLLAAALLGACASGHAPPPPRPPEKPPELSLGRHDRAYLVDPLEGYPDAVSAALRDRLEHAWRALLERADTAGAADAAAELLAADPDLAPAQVLAAQVDFAAGRAADVVVRLLPINDQRPTYVASQLLCGRAAEQAGDIPLAYAAFRAIATKSALAFQRLGELHPRAMEILANRLQDEVRTGMLDPAQKNLALLESWGPAETVTFEGARAVAVARRDLRGELAAVKELSRRRPQDRALLDRRAELELAVGDPGAGLQIVQDLAARNPRDPQLAEKLAAAKFRWHLSLLPATVQEVAGKDELNRGDFATLLYWLIPGVRYARPTSGRIATDVLGHPHQEEIVRVVNLGLLDVDSTLHRFSPAAPVRRGQALRSLTRALAELGQENGQAAACLGDLGRSPSPGAVCTAAAACGLVAGEDDCEAGEGLAGSDAVELIRLTLKHLGGT